MKNNRILSALLVLVCASQVVASEDCPQGSAEATTMHPCYTLPGALMLKCRFLELNSGFCRCAGDQVDQYAQISQKEIDSLRSESLPEKLTETPLYKEDRSEMNGIYKGEVEEVHAKRYDRLSKRTQTMKTTAAQDLYHKLRESNFSCETTALTIKRLLDI